MIVIIGAGSNPDVDEHLITLGLTASDLAKLALGVPLHLNALTSPGFPTTLQLLIFVGTDDRAMVERMLTHLPEDTKLVLVPPTSGGQPC